MGKNHSKKKQKTELSRWESIMRKLENELAKNEQQNKKDGKENGQKNE